MNPKTHKVEEELKFPFNKIYRERLRLGTVDLIHTLQEKNIEVWVYTSSYRSEKYIKGLFKRYGVFFDEIINAPRHLEEVQAGHKEPLPQKMPNKYRISLHVDDEKVISTYGKIYGFNVFHLDEPDDEWAEKILAKVDEISKRR